MIWATVSSWSCFCWLYRASPFLAAKNIINLISVLTVWWSPRVESSLVLLEEGICYDQCILLEKLLAFALFHFVLQHHTCLLFQISLEFLLLPSNPLLRKGPFLCVVLILEGFFYLDICIYALVIENTLLQQHKRSLCTWTSPDGQHRNQIDYILCSQRWRSSI